MSSSNAALTGYSSFCTTAGGLNSSGIGARGIKGMGLCCSCACGMTLVNMKSMSYLISLILSNSEANYC